MKRVLATVILFLFTFLMFKEGIFAEDYTVNIGYDAEINAFSLEENQDLFVDLKNVVPGDNLIQNINLKVTNLKSGEAVKIYLKAENPNDDYNTLTSLNGVTLTVSSNGERIEAEINEPLLIGYFIEDDVVNIDVDLAVDKTVGNEIANLDADIDWVFSAEIIENTDTPKTGDSSSIGWIALTCIISLGVICLILILRKRV